MDAGLPFRLDDLWHHSALDAGPADETLFRDPNLNLQPLQAPQPIDEQPLIAADLDLDLPDPGADHDGHHLINDDHEHDLININNRHDGSFDAQPVRTSQYGQTTALVPDLWSLDIELPNNTTGTCALRTWDAFARTDIPGQDLNIYLSEAKAEAFDAAWWLTYQCGGVLPQDTSIRALCNLALGRSSVFFQWEPSKEIFTQTLSDITTSSLSLPCHGSFVSRLIQYGSKYRQLQGWAEARQSAQSPAAVQALKQVTLRTLQAVETSIAVRVPHIRTLLQLQQSISLPCQLLDHLCDLQETASVCTTEEQAISSISGCIQAAEETGDLFAGVLRLALKDVCAPWLETLSFQLGLSSGHVQHTCVGAIEGRCTKNKLNMSFSNTSPAQLSTSTLLDRNDQVLIKETKESLSLVRLHMPYLRVRCPGLGAISTSSHTSISAPRTVENKFLDRSDEMDALFELSELIPDTDFTRLEMQDTLCRAVTEILDTGVLEAVAQEAGLESVVVQNPFDTLRPTIILQARYLNREVLRHIFDSCGLKKHLELQRAFHLLGNGDFVTRLSIALFSPETQTARRTRGTVPTGELLGLRLGTRDGQAWPPASSELRLTLNEVLADSCHDLKPSRSGVPVELPGNLSFSIRELPDEEIDRVMDVSSIYALDFLRLQYTAPAPLDAIMTSGSLLRYDDIFRFLLMILRVLDVTKRLRREHLLAGRLKASVASRFAIAAHDFTCNLMSTLMEVGIGEPWQDFQRAVDSVWRSVTFNEGPDPAERLETGLKSLRQMHADCLEDIRSRLFLKSKQAKARNALHEVLATVLRACSRSHDSLPGFSDLEFRESVSELLGLLQATVDKPPKYSGSQAHEVEMARLLLARLNFNEAFRVVS